MEGKGRVEKEGKRKGMGELEETGNRMTKMEEGQRGRKRKKKYLD